MPGRLAGKVALITGAGCVGPGWGNGRAECVLFAQEGAKIFAVDRDMSQMDETIGRLKQAGADFAVHSCDVTNSKQVAAMVEACVTRFGRIDILVNNVGGSRTGRSGRDGGGGVGRPGRSQPQEYFSDLQIRDPGDGGAGRRRDRQHRVSLGLRYTGAAQVAYAACKAGVIQFSQGGRGAVRAEEIRVNTLVPGQLHTPMVEARLAKTRAGGDVEKAPGAAPVAHSPGLHGRRPRHRERRALPRLRRSALRHRHRDRARRRHDGEV